MPEPLTSHWLYGLLDGQPLGGRVKQKSATVPGRPNAKTRTSPSPELWRHFNRQLSVGRHFFAK